MSGLTIICSDGGLRAGFIAGALSELIKKFPKEIAEAETIAATSASVGCVFYFLSHHEHHPARALWTKALAAPEFSPGKWWNAVFGGKPLYDIDYMVDHIIRCCYPLNVDNIKNTHYSIYFPVLNYETMQVEYFTNRPEIPFVRKTGAVPLHDIRTHDPYELIRASNAVPMLYDKVVRIDGQDFLDAGQIEPYALDIPTAGGKKILIATRYKSSWKESLNYFIGGYLWAYVLPLVRKLGLKKEIYLGVARKPQRYAALGRAVDRLRRSGEIFVIVPSEHLHGRLHNDEVSLLWNFESGERWVQRNVKKLRRFLDK